MLTAIVRRYTKTSHFAMDTNYRKRITVVVFIAAVCAPLFAQSTTVSQTIKELRKIKADASDPLPVTARPLLTKLKHQLSTLIIEIIQAPENQHKTPAKLQAIILQKLKELEVKVGDYPDGNQDEYIYGDVNEIVVRYAQGNSEILTVTTTIGVCCGEDTSLYVFKRDHSHWKIVLTQEANGYKDVSGAQGRFSYAVSKLDNQQNFFVVTARVNPWCTSNWQGLYYRVLRPGSQPHTPKILFVRKEIIYLGTDRVYELRLTGNTFTLSFETEATEKQIYNGINSRLLKLKYAVTGNQVKKVPFR